MPFSQTTLDLQKELLAAGYDPGPLDGIMGPKTQAAIAARESAETETEVSQEGEPEGNTEAAAREEPTGILEGGRTFKIGRPGEEPLFFHAYRVPGSTSNEWALFQFDSEESLEDFFGEEVGSITYFSEETFFRATESGQFTISGDASELAGLPGDFQGLWTRTMNEALVAGGVTDPSVRGRLLNDPEVQRILTLANLGEFSGATLDDNTIKAQLRQTDIWRNDLYAGIDFFYERGDAEPEAAWRAYQNNVRDGLRELGVQPDPDGSYSTTIGDMLNNGISDQEFDKFLPTAIKIQENPGFKTQVDAWAERELGRPTSTDEFIDLLQGTNDPELDAIVEKATLAYAAEQAGIQGIPVEEIENLAADTNLSATEALAAFTAQEAQLLRIGEQDLGFHGITRGDFLDVAAGRKPRSGKTAAEVTALGSQLASERAISDDPGARFFLGFGERGQPQRAGLQSIAPVGG